MESAGKRAAEARAKMNRARVELVELPEAFQPVGSVAVVNVRAAFGLKHVELRAPTMRASHDAAAADGFGTLSIAMSAMVWLPAEGDQPAEQLWPTPQDVGAAASDNGHALNWLYDRALTFLAAGKEAAPKD